MCPVSIKWITYWKRENCVKILRVLVEFLIVSDKYFSWRPHVYQNIIAADKRTILLVYEPTCKTNEIRNIDILKLGFQQNQDNVPKLV